MYIIQMNVKNKTVPNGTKQLRVYSLPLDKINNYFHSSSYLGNIYGVDESDAMSVSIYSMHTKYNGLEHKIHLEDRAQLLFMTHEELHLTRKSSKQSHVSVHDNKYHSFRYLKIRIYQQYIGTMCII